MPNWTKDQKTVIENRGGSLLVSAAAGSGKTAVLVERVLNRITDKKDPIDIDRFLLVTFTNAAAAEMRSRISAALSEAVAKNPKDARLRRQLFLVHRAKITTVHSLCLSLAKEHASVLGIAPDFRLMDDQEADILKASVLEDVLDAAYEQSDNQNFNALCELVCSGSGDAKLGKVILGTWEKIQSHPDPRIFLETIRERLYSKSGDEPYIKELINQSKMAAEYGMSFLKIAVDMIKDCETLEKKYLPAFEEDINNAKCLLRALDNGNWDECVKIAGSIEFTSLKPVRVSDDPELAAVKDAVQAMREEFKEVVNNVCTKYKWLTVTSDEAREDREKTAPALSALIDMVNAFDDAFSNAKREKNAADFGDLEHFAIKLLYDNGIPSKLAATLSKEYSEIAVDEYQDTNEVQDAIFRALSKNEQNLFMVGDVKQSIYSFRLADPSIFLEKYRSFSDAENARPGEPRRVILGQNFRSRKEVLDSCNYIFSNVMGLNVGDMEYTDQEALHPGAEYPRGNGSDYKTEFLLLDTSGLDRNDQDSPEKTQAEAILVAKRIREMLDGKLQVLDKITGEMRDVTPNDIVVLLRSPAQRAKRARIYVSALEDAGINATAKDSGGLLETTEVGAVVSLLSVIDNPRQDVDLIGAMRSPLFGFTEQELAEIRLNSKGTVFYDAVCLAARLANESGSGESDAPLKQKTAQKTKEFLETLKGFREFSGDQPIYRLIWEIYDKTDAMGLYGSLPNGTQRQENLISFFERARVFESQGSCGLFAFMRLLRGMRETDGDFETTAAETSGNMVRIMSIHKSKGLEFPVVVLANCAGCFNNTDLRESLLVHGKLGFGSKCLDVSRGLQYDTLGHIAIRARKRRETVSEELRVLYVALTRAKEKLIITGSMPARGATLKKWARLASLEKLPQYAMGNANSPLIWIIAPLLKLPCTDELKKQFDLDVPNTKVCDAFQVKVYTPDMLSSGPSSDKNTSADNDTGNEIPSPDTSELEANLNFHYPYAYLATLPSKLTATEIVQSGLSEETSVNPHDDTGKLLSLRKPLFDRSEKKLTPTEIGSAHHMFMQFCDFSVAAEVGGTQKELERLEEKRFLTPEQAKAINLKKIEKFFSSELYLELIAKNKIRREYRFSVLVPASEYYKEASGTSDEKVLLQGIIDCLIDTPDGFVILDFKTDRVSEKQITERAEHYRPQLQSYSLAIQKIFEKPVKKRILYFFSNGCVYELN